MVCFLVEFWRGKAPVHFLRTLFPLVLRTLKIIFVFDFEKLTRTYFSWYFSKMHSNPQYYTHAKLTTSNQLKTIPPAERTTVCPIIGQQHSCCCIQSMFKSINFSISYWNLQFHYNHMFWKHWLTKLLIKYLMSF